MSEVWAKWESQIINGVFPLRRFLGGSDHSGVFLTEYKARSLPDAAIKLIPAVPAQADAQLAQWRAVAALSHPRLIRLIAMGRCRLGDRQFLFVVMEYAEQTLSQILAQRALTPDEVREMLPPVVDALRFLHLQHLVQGQLKPANILAVGDQLKLSSDTIRPDAGDDRFSTARDIWNLGMTVVEALTQRVDAASPAEGLPEEFAGMVRQCLNADPAQRPTLAALEIHLKLEPPAPLVLAPPPADPGTAAPSTAATAPSAPLPQPAAPPPPGPLAQPVARPREPLPAREASVAVSLGAGPGKRRWYTLGVAVALLSWLAVWAFLHRHHPAQAQAPALASAPTVVPAPAQEAPAAIDGSAVLHEEIPAVSAGARATIHGRIQVAVRVSIDSAGNVTDAALTHPGSSKYFARLATDAAKRWKFAPAGNQDARQRLLIFEFARSGASGHASPPRP